MENLNLENESCLHDCRFCTGCEENSQSLNEEEGNDLMSTKLEFIDEVLENFGKISLVTNYFTAKEIALELGVLDYEDYFAIDLQSDSFLYLVDITPNELFVIEPLQRSNGYYYIETEQLIIDSEIEDELDDEFFEFVDGNILTINFDEKTFSRDCNGCECCSDCNCEENEEDVALYESLSDMVEEYALLIEDTNGCPNCIRRTLLEFTIDLLENFGMETIDL